MPFPTPKPGLLIRYAFLWREAASRGQEEGEKDRPCAVVLTVADADGGTTVLVLPVTHSPPADADAAIEIPAGTKRRLGLDDDRSWIIVTEANRFRWPGPDLRPRKAGDMTSAAYGMLPAALILEMRGKLARAIRARRFGIVTRSL